MPPPADADVAVFQFADELLDPPLLLLPHAAAPSAATATSAPNRTFLLIRTLSLDTRHLPGSWAEPHGRYAR